jgi:hypothetical protein
MWRGLETWHGRDAVTLADERARQQENTNFDLNRRASLRPYRENPDGDAKGKSTSGYNREAESTDAPERGGLLRSSEEAGIMPVERREQAIAIGSGPPATGGTR